MIINTEPIKNEISARILAKTSGNRNLFKLIVVLIGDDFASVKYSNIKKKIGEKLNIEVILLMFKKETVQINEINNRIQNIKDSNSTSTIGLIFQLPIENELWSSILENNFWEKYKMIDVDNLKNDNCVIPPTIGSITEIIKTKYPTDEGLEGLSVCVLGQGRLVGKHIVNFLLTKNVTIHSFNKFSKNIEKFASESDILICCAGKPYLVDSTFINKKSPNGQLIIDASTSEDNGALVGDLSLDNILNYLQLNNLDSKISISKTPGGVGGVTVYKLFENLVFSV